MILKKITLNNIRSYNSHTLEFPEGSTLLAGDIGAGKTSILLGIEFALFGLQPGQKGGSLLRNGEKEGSVTLEFEVEDSQIKIERSLKRGKSVSQDRCIITIDGETSELAVTEIKDRVLNLLNYPKEFAKKQNLLYKFTVYTPQEEMKEIIIEDPETRINTLRHVFGIDKYKKILENTSILSSKLREEKRLREGMIETLEQDKVSLTGKEEELEAKHYNLASVEKELFSKTEKRKKLQEEKDETLNKIEERKSLQQEIEKMKIMIANKKESLLGNKKILLQLESQIKELSELKFEEAEIPNTEEEISKDKKRKEEFNEQNISISSRISSLNLKSQENETLKSKISHIEICPTCLQTVDSVYKSNMSNKLDSEIKQNTDKTKELELEKQVVLNNLKDINEKISSNEKKLQDLKIIRIQVKDIDEKRSRLSEVEHSSESIQKDINMLEENLESINKSVFDLGRFVNIHEIKQREFDDALKEERFAEIKVAELKKEIEVFSRQIEELRERINRTEEVKIKLDNVTKIESWLSKNFSPLISLIEKNVMIKLKSEFSSLFAKWFSMLVSDNFEVRLDDNFTPVIEHQDYEIDYAYLSGGERTAVALAYRLSLNQVINSIMSRIKTRELVILDEPTDGFSEQQLDKMRDVLKQLDFKQLIIVSHEQKIEGFVENVIRLNKEHGTTSIASEDFIQKN